MGSSKHAVEVGISGSSRYGWWCSCGASHASAGWEYENAAEAARLHQAAGPYIDARREVDQLHALLRQVREATNHVQWAHDICHLIDESHLLGEPSDG